MRTRELLRGFTVIEALIGMLVTIGIIGALMLMARQANEATQTQRFMGQVDNIADVVRALYPNGSPSGYTGVSAAVIWPSVDPGMQMKGAELINTFGGSFTVLPSNWLGEVNRAARVSASNVPASMCTSLVMAMKANFDGIAVNRGGSFVKQVPAIDLDAPAVNVACKNNQPSSNTVTLHFYIL